MPTPSVPRAAPCLAALALTAVLGGGCVERKMVLRSDPAGALITLDGRQTEERTPAEIPFDWGGTRQVTLSAPGHKLLEADATLSDPWFTYFPLDVFAEFLWPGTIHDVQTFDYRLEPYVALDKSFTEEQSAALKKKLGELKLRAEEYRAGGSEGPGKTIAPPPAPAAPPGKPAAPVDLKSPPRPTEPPPPPGAPPK